MNNTRNQIDEAREKLERLRGEVLSARRELISLEQKYEEEQTRFVSENIRAYIPFADEIRDDAFIDRVTHLDIRVTKRPFTGDPSSYFIAPTEQIVWTCTIGMDGKRPTMFQVVKDHWLYIPKSWLDSCPEHWKAFACAESIDTNTWPEIIDAFPEREALAIALFAWGVNRACGWPPEIFRRDWGEEGANGYVAEML